MARSHIGRMLEARIREATADLTADVGAGKMPDFPAYKYQCGMIRSYFDVLAMIEEIEKENT